MCLHKITDFYGLKEQTRYRVCSFFVSFAINELHPPPYLCAVRGLPLRMKLVCSKKFFSSLLSGDCAPVLFLGGMLSPPCVKKGGLRSKTGGLFLRCFDVKIRPSGYE